MRHWLSTSNIIRGFWVSPKSPIQLIAITTAFQTALQVAMTHHGTVPNNPDLVPISIKKIPQQLIVATANIPPTINALIFANPMGEFF